MARRSRLGIVFAVAGLSVLLVSYLALAQPQAGAVPRIDPSQGGLVDLADGSSGAQACAAQARLWNDLKTKILAAASQPGVSASTGDLAKELARQNDPSAGGAGAVFLQKLAKTLQVINVFSTVSRAAGYTWDGDRTGAYSVPVEEGIKKTTVAADRNVRKETGPDGAGAPR